MSVNIANEKNGDYPSGMEEGTPFVQIVGPLFLVFALALAGKTTPVFNYDLLLVAAIGMFWSAKWRIRGCAYAFVILMISAIVKHLTIRDHHLFQASLEGSVGFSLLICALVSEQRFSFFGSLKQQIENRSQTIEYLEDDLAKQRETANLECASLGEKLANQQQLLEEVQADIDALHMLNEVLRKSSASAIDEKVVFSSQILQMQSQAGLLLEEIDLLQKELNRLGNKSELSKQNGELFQELNAARFKEEQTHLVNETLARLHAQQNQRVKELEAEKVLLIREIRDLRSELDQAIKRVEDIQIQAQESMKINELEGERIELLHELENRKGIESEKEKTIAELLKKREEIESKATHWEVKALELNSSIQGLQSLHLEKLGTLEAEAEKNHYRHAEQLKEFSIRLEQSANMEALYRQLKAQFEEKNQLLHQVRAHAFLLDTELQTIKMQAQQKLLETDPLPGSIRKEIESMEIENRSLLDENILLHDLITNLMQASETIEPKAVKKKVKTRSSSEQSTLF